MIHGLLIGQLLSQMNNTTKGLMFHQAIAFSS